MSVPVLEQRRADIRGRDRYALSSPAPAGPGSKTTSKDMLHTPHPSTASSSPNTPTHQYPQGLSVPPMQTISPTVGVFLASRMALQFLNLNLPKVHPRSRTVVSVASTFMQSRASGRRLLSWTLKIHQLHHPYLPIQNAGFHSKGIWRGSQSGATRDVWIHSTRNLKSLKSSTHMDSRRT